MLGGQSIGVKRGERVAGLGGPWEMIQRLVRANSGGKREDTMSLSRWARIYCYQNVDSRSMPGLQLVPDNLSGNGALVTAAGRAESAVEMQESLVAALAQAT